MDERIRRLDHPEKLAAYEKTRVRTSYANLRVKEWRIKYPERYKAHNKLNNAVRDGKIVKPDHCEICGKPGHIHAHHSDYSDQLLVVWICARCHGQIQ
jgi:ribosomal protein S27AE